MLPSIPDDLRSIGEISREGSIFSLKAIQPSHRRHRHERRLSVETLTVDQSRQDSWLDRTRQRIHCSLFCGGRRCKFERWSAITRKEQERCAIQGLISNWVGEDLIASQRPSSSLFPKFSLIQQFKAKKVTAVVNLQEKGEHRNCGPDGILTSTGYSYSANDDLMANGITCYEYPWADMTTPEQDVVLRSIQVMDNHVRSKGKVLVHCHAGLGRTGLLIACYYVYRYHMSSWEAIHLVRGSRPGAIQTPHQFKFICSFEQHLWRLSQAFCMPLSDAKVDVDAFVQRQRHILHGMESDLHRYTPMFLHKVLCRLINLVRFDKTKAQSVLESFSLSSFPDSMILNQCRTGINRLQFNVNETYNEVLLAFLVVDWFRSLSKPALSAEKCRYILGFQQCCRRPSSSVNTTDGSPFAPTSGQIPLPGVQFVPSTVSEFRAVRRQESTLSSEMASAPTVAYNDDQSPSLLFRPVVDSGRPSSGAGNVPLQEKMNASLEHGMPKGKKDDDSSLSRKDASPDTEASSHQPEQPMYTYSHTFSSQSFSSSEICSSCSVSETTSEGADKDALNETNVMRGDSESETMPEIPPRRSMTKSQESFLAPLTTKRDSTATALPSMKSVDRKTSNPFCTTANVELDYSSEIESTTLLPSLRPCTSGRRQDEKEITRSGRSTSRASSSNEPDSINEGQKKWGSSLSHLEGSLLSGSASDAVYSFQEGKNSVRVKGRKGTSSKKPFPEVNPLLVPLILQSPEIGEKKGTREMTLNDDTAPPHGITSVNNPTEMGDSENGEHVAGSSATIFGDPSEGTLPYTRSPKLSPRNSTSEVPTKNEQGGGDDEKTCEVGALGKNESPASQKKKKERAKRTANASPPAAVRKNVSVPRRTSFHFSSGEPKGEWGGEWRQSTESARRKVSSVTSSKSRGVKGEYAISSLGSANNSVSPVFTSSVSRKNSRSVVDRPPSQKEGKKGGNGGHRSKRSPSPGVRGTRSRHEKSRKKKGKSEGRTESTGSPQRRKSWSPAIPSLAKSPPNERNILKGVGGTPLLYYFNTVLTPAVRHTIGMVLSFVECVCSAELMDAERHEGNKVLGSPPSLERYLEGERHRGTVLEEEAGVTHRNPFSCTDPPETDSPLTAARPCSTSTSISEKEKLSSLPCVLFDSKMPTAADMKALKRHAYSSLIDSFTHECHAVERSYLPEEHEILCDFFMECGSLIGDAYFNPDAPSASKAASRSINRIALASKGTLEETRVSDACLFSPPPSPGTSCSYSRIPIYTHCEADNPLNRNLLPKRSSAKLRKLVGTVFNDREVQNPEQTNISTTANVLQTKKYKGKVPLSSISCSPGSMTAKGKEHSHIPLPSQEKTSCPATYSALLSSTYCSEENPLEGTRRLSPIEATSKTIGSCSNASSF